MPLTAGRSRRRLTLAAAFLLVAPGCSASGDQGLGVARALRTPPPEVRAVPLGSPPATPSPSPTPSRQKDDGSPKPVMEGNFADPDVLDAGGIYYAYATNSRGQNVPYATAPSLRGPWTRRGDALPVLGPWAQPGLTWAPEVARRPDGMFVLYYTAASRYHRTQCIGVATSRWPQGPFHPVGTHALLCQDGEFIDPAFFRNGNGAAYLLYRGHQGSGPTAIYLRRLGKAWLGFSAPPVRVMTWDRRQDPHLVEAPALVRQGGRFMLFYSSGLFYEPSYRTRYAVARRLAGPYRPVGGPLLSTVKFRRQLVGPGGADIMRDRDGFHIVFHAITQFGGGANVVRGMYVADLDWRGGHPVVRDVS